MSTRLLLVRHGQASIDADDYDQLSELGRAQCVALGHYLRAHQRPWTQVVHGSMRRHQQSYAALAQGMEHALSAHIDARFDEYDFRLVLSAYAQLRASEAQVSAAVQQGGRAWLKHLRPALTDWAMAKLELPAEQQHALFVQRVTRALDGLATQSGPVLVLTSGGVIGTVVGHALGMSATDAVRLNLVIENSSVTELDVEEGRMHLVRFNSVAHLSDPALRSLV